MKTALLKMTKSMFCSKRDSGRMTCIVYSVWPGQCFVYDQINIISDKGPINFFNHIQNTFDKIFIIRRKLFN